MGTIWLRAEERANERRTALMPEGVAALIGAGFDVVVEDNPDRCVSTADFVRAGARLVPQGSWRTAPAEAIILGLKELPADDAPLRHRHIMFGHAYKGQPEGPALLGRFRAGGGTLLDLEYLTDDTGRRLAAFGYWAGFAGAAVSMIAWAAQETGGVCPPVAVWKDASTMVADVQAALLGKTPNALVIGALGRVGTGVRDLCKRAGVTTTDWDLAETASGGPFTPILEHDVFFNCILAGPGCPVFVPPAFVESPRRLRVIGDIACDPGSPYNPIPVYGRATDWNEPTVRVARAPVLDVMAIDNLPSLLPAESSADFAAQLLPVLLGLGNVSDPTWQRAEKLFRDKAGLSD